MLCEIILAVAAAAAGSALGASVAPHLRGKISEAAKYERLHPRFTKAFEFMRRPDLAELPCGRYEIDGSNCWAMVSEAALKPFEEKNQYEVHCAQCDKVWYNTAKKGGHGVRDA